MPIVGFNFDKIFVEKKKFITKGDIRIKPDVAIKDMSEQDLKLGKSKQKLLKINYEFKVDYSPNIGEIMIKGHLLFMEDPDKNIIYYKHIKDRKIPYFY